MRRVLEAAAREIFRKNPTAIWQTGARSGEVDEPLIEFTMQGEIVREVKLLDLLDPYRVGYGSIGNGAALRNVSGPPDSNPRHDWAHFNAVVMDPIQRPRVFLDT